MGSATNQIATINDCKKINSSAFSSITGDAAKECVTYKDINGNSTVNKYLQAGSVNTLNFTTKVTSLTGYTTETSDSSYVSDPWYLYNDSLPTARYTPSAAVNGSAYVDMTCTIPSSYIGNNSFTTYVSVSLQIFIGNDLVWSYSKSFTPTFYYSNQSQSSSLQLNNANTGSIINNWDNYERSGQIYAKWNITTGQYVNVSTSATIQAIKLVGKQANTSNQLVKYSDIKSLTSTPTRCTFTINASPSDANVTITTNGYTQSGNSITVPPGHLVSWTVSKAGYTTQSGSQIVNSDYVKYVTLSVASGGSGGSSTSSSSRLGVWE